MILSFKEKFNEIGICGLMNNAQIHRKNADAHI